MKKITALMLVLAMMLVCFASCTATDNGGNTSATGTTQAETEKAKSDFDEIKADGTLVIGVTYYKPMNYFEGEDFVGFDTEYAQAVCEKLGLEPQFSLINWDTKESNLKSGNIDCIWNGLTVSEERKADMAFTDSYLVNKQCIVINKEDAKKFTDTAAIAADAVAITAEKGSAGETAIQADENLAKITYTGSEDQQSAVNAVKNGNADAAVVDITLAQSVCGKGDFENLVVLNIGLTDEEYAIGFRIGSDMVELVNKATKELIEDGTLAKIAAKYELTDLFNEIINK